MDSSLPLNVQLGAPADFVASCGAGGVARAALDGGSAAGSVAAAGALAAGAADGAAESSAAGVTGTSDPLEEAEQAMAQKQTAQTDKDSLEAARSGDDESFIGGTLE